MSEKIIRDSNFELLRIVLIVMIICLHYLGHGGSLEVLRPSDFNFYLAYALESFFIIAVNCFILITGFFQINKECNFKKVVDLWTQVFFYSVLISSIFWIFKLEPINIKNVIQMIFPVITGRWWFITVYIMLYCFSPFINTALNHMEKNTHKELLLVLAFFFVILPSFRPNITYFQDTGYSLYNFVFLYSVGAYIRKYDVLYKINFLYAYFLCSLSIFLVSAFVTITCKKCISFFYYNFIPVELSAIFLFIYFKNTKISSPKINEIATSVFGIYLISSDPFIRNILYSKILHCADYYYSPFFLLHMVVSLVGIFSFCLVIETFRQRLFTILYPVWNYRAIRISHRLRHYYGLAFSDENNSLKTKITIFFSMRNRLKD